MSSPDAPAAPVEEVKTEAPVQVAEAPKDVTKVEETTVPAPDEAAPPQAAAEAPKVETAVAVAEGEAVKKDDRPKSPGLIAKLLAGFKDKGKEKKPKAAKSPRKKDDKKEASASSEEPAKDAPTEETAPTAPAAEAPAEPTPEAATATAAVTETPAEPKVETKAAEETPEVKETPKEEKKEDLKTKLGRRISGRFGNLFHMKAKSEVNAPAKVEENPPQIENPPPVAPLEDVAQSSAPAAPAAEAPVVTATA